MISAYSLQLTNEKNTQTIVIPAYSLQFTAYNPPLISGDFSLQNPAYNLQMTIETWF